MRIPRYDRQVAPEPTATGGAQTSIGIGSPTGPARNPAGQALQQLGNVAGDIFKRQQEKKDRTDSLNAIAGLSEQMLTTSNEALALKGQNTEGVTARALEQFDGWLAEIEKSGISERAMQSVQSAAIRMRMNLGSSLGRHERVETDAAEVAAQEAVAEQMLKQLAAVRGGPEGVDHTLVQSGINDALASAKAISIQAGLDAHTAAVKADGAVSRGLSAMVLGMLTDGDIKGAREVFDQYGTRFGPADHEKIQVALEGDERDAAASDLADRAHGMHSGPGSLSAQLKVVRESGAHEDVISGAIAQVKQRFSLDETGRQDREFALLREAEARLDDPAFKPSAALREILGVEGMKDYRQRRQRAGTAGAMTGAEVKKYHYWRENVDNGNFYTAMSRDQAYAFMNSLPVEYEGVRAGSEFIELWGKHVRAQAAAERTGQEKAAKDSGYTGTSMADRTVRDIFDVAPGDTLPEKHATAARHLREQFNEDVRALGGDKQAAQQAAEVMLTQYGDEDDAWYSFIPFLGEGQRKHISEFTLKEIMDEGMNLREDLRTELERDSIVPAIQRLVNEGMSGEYAPGDVDEEDDDTVGYVLMLRRIIQSRRTTDMQKNEANAKLLDIFGRLPAERVFERLQIGARFKGPTR